MKLASLQDVRMWGLSLAKSAWEDCLADLAGARARGASEMELEACEADVADAEAYFRACEEVA